MIYCFLFLFGCSMKNYNDVAVIDIIDNNVCLVQLPDESMLEISGRFCTDLKEGDVIKVERVK